MAQRSPKPRRTKLGKWSRPPYRHCEEHATKQSCIASRHRYSLSLSKGGSNHGSSLDTGSFFLYTVIAIQRSINAARRVG